MDGMQTDQAKAIASKYLALVERFNATPQKSVERIKMLLAFDPWFRSHAESLTEDEKEYLKSNIHYVDLDEKFWSYTY